MGEDEEGKIEEATELVTTLVISLADDVISREIVEDCEKATKKKGVY